MNGEYKTYRIIDATGVPRFRAVVQAAGAIGDVTKPAAANAGQCKGIAQEDQLTQNRNVNVKKHGRTFAVAAGLVTVGDAVNIADNVGRLQSCEADRIAAPGVAQVLNIVGYAETGAALAGDIFEVDLNIHTVKTAVS